MSMNVCGSAYENGCLVEDGVVDGTYVLRQHIEYYYYYYYEWKLPIDDHDTIEDLKMT